MRESLWPEVPDSIEKRKRAKIKMIMIIGDNKYTAEATSRNVGILDKD